MPNRFATLNQQLAAAVETTNGTAVTVVAADVKLRPFLDFTHEPIYPEFAVEEVAEDLAQAPDFAGGKGGQLSFGCSLKNGGVLGTPPAIGRYFRGCGLKEQVVNQITVGVQSGGDSQFKAGETYSATGGKTGTIEADRVGAGVLRYTITSGGALVAADSVTAAGDSATTSGTNTVHSVKYSPRSTGLESLTMERLQKNYLGTSSKDRILRLRGAMGTARLETAALDAARARFEFKGAEAADVEGNLYTGVVYEDISIDLIPKLVNADIQINGAPVTPEGFTFDFGNEVQLEPDPTLDGGPSGFLSAAISGRKPSITLAPFQIEKTVLDMLNLNQVRTAVPVQFIFGTTPQKIMITAPRCQIRGFAQANRAGFEVKNLTIAITRAVGTDFDYGIYFM
jgi:hypothetical protein